MMLQEFCVYQGAQSDGLCLTKNVEIYQGYTVDVTPCVTLNKEKPLKVTFEVSSKTDENKDRKKTNKEGNQMAKSKKSMKKAGPILAIITALGAGLSDHPNEHSF